MARLFLTPITAAAGSFTALSASDLTLAGSFTSDVSLYDPLYSYAVADLDGRAGFGLLRDGTFFTSKPAGISITGNAATATTAASVETALRNDFPTGESQYGDSGFTDQILYSIQDVSGRTAFGVYKSGKLLIGAVQNFRTFSQVHGAAGLYSVSVDQFGRAQIVLGGNSGISILTTQGNNWNPSVTQETPQRIAFLSDRLDNVNYWVMNSDGTRQARAIPDSSVTFWGDSMTQRLQSYGHLPALLAGRTLTYNALGATTIEHIAARQGGENATCVIPSGSIPASGSVALTNVWPSLGYHAGTITPGATYSFLVTIAGVQGTLLSTTNSSSQADYTFTRTSNGTAVTVSGPVEINVITDLSNSMGYDKQNTAIFWVGTNAVSNLPSTTYNPSIDAGLYYKSPATTYDPGNSAVVQARTEALVAAMISRCENLDRHILFVGPFLGQNGVWATSTEKLAIVAGLSNFTKYWYDLRVDFIATCKTWLQTNHSSVYANWSASDDARVADGASPPILREDAIHLNTYGSQLVSQLIAARLTSKQW